VEEISFRSILYGWWKRHADDALVFFDKMVPASRLSAKIRANGVRSPFPISLTRRLYVRDDPLPSPPLHRCSYRNSAIRDVTYTTGTVQVFSRVVRTTGQRRQEGRRIRKPPHGKQRTISSPNARSDCPSYKPRVY